MAYKSDFSLATCDQIEAALCKQLENIRLSRNMTQLQLAAEAGVSLRTIGRLEKGLGVSLETFIRVLTALGLQQRLESMLPDPKVRPFERLRPSGGERKRARPSKHAASDVEGSWSWGDGGGDEDA